MRRRFLPGSGLVIVLGVLTAAPGRAERTTAPVSAPLGKVRYEVTFDSTTALTRTIKVAMTFDVAGPGPGAALASRLDARRLRDELLRALGLELHRDGGGQALAWDKLDYDTWRRAAGGAPGRLRCGSTTSPTRSTTRWRGPGPTSPCSTAPTSCSTPRGAARFPRHGHGQDRAGLARGHGHAGRPQRPRTLPARRTTTISWTCRSSSAGSITTARRSRDAGPAWPPIRRAALSGRRASADSGTRSAR